MNSDTTADKAKTMLDEQTAELCTIVDRAGKDEDFQAARERIKRWKSRTAKLILESVNPDEAMRFEKLRKGSFIMNDPFRNLADEGDMYRGFLSALKEEIEKHPNDILSAQTVELPRPIQVPPPTASRTVFIVHGHDELNTLRLEKLLRERWYLESIILKFEPGKGRTLIEKFEEEAQKAVYAIVLFTADDFIEVAGTKYTQARPNVIFELGWFYGRLGRPRVCILFKKGTKIPSDLDGIMRIEFNDDVSEKIIELEKELKAANLLSRAKGKA